MMGGMGDAAAIASALAKTKRRGHAAAEAAKAPAPPPINFDAHLDDGPVAGKAYPSGEWYPRRKPGPHPYDCVPPGARRPVVFPAEGWRTPGAASLCRLTDSSSLT